MPNGLHHQRPTQAFSVSVAMLLAGWCMRWLADFIF
jgi:hypothetical protein